MGLGPGLRKGAAGLVNDTPSWVAVRGLVTADVVAGVGSCSVRRLGPQWTWPARVRSAPGGCREEANPLELCVDTRVGSALAAPAGEEGHSRPGTPVDEVTAAQLSSENRDNFARNP